MIVSFEVYKVLGKEPMARKLFEQEAKFLEVSQAFLRQLLGKLDFENILLMVIPDKIVKFDNSL